MISLGFPYALALPLIYLIIRVSRRRTAPPSVTFSSAPFLRKLPQSLRVRLRVPVLLLLEITCVLSLAIASARPQRVTVLDQTNLGRNIMLVVDASNSMSANDFPTRFGTTTRMEGVKTVVAEYVRNRRGDRVGLVVFGNSAYLQSPLTSDTALVESLVQLLRPRMAGDGTAIGDGLGLALKRLRAVEDSSKAVILMTDGVNTAGQVSPLKAAQVAKELGVQIHTIGIGSGQAPLVQQPLGGLLSSFPAPMAEFDEETLRAIAKSTGGVYFNATSLEGFKDVYKQIDELSKTEDTQPQKPVVEELFAPFAVTGLLSMLLSLILNATIFRRIP